MMLRVQEVGQMISPPFSQGCVNVLMYLLTSL